MGLFINASPEYIWLGAHDKSSRTLPYQRDPIPQHVPLVYIFAEKGTPKKEFMAGATAAAIYGSETFNPDSKFHMHTTELLANMFGAGNACTVKRVIPADATHASVVTYIDIAAGTVPNFVRDSMGNIVIDPGTQAPMVDATTPTITGINFKYVAEEATGAFGSATPKAGTMTGSTMYPIMEHRALAGGAFYNNLGIGVQSMLNSELDSATIVANKALTYRFGIYTRTAAGTPQPLASLFGSPNVVCSFKAGAKDAGLGTKIDVQTVFDTNWYNETNPLMSVRYHEFEGMHLYQANIETVLGMVLANEKAHISSVLATWHDTLQASTLSWFDFTTADQTAIDAERHLIDLFSGSSSKGVPYFTFVHDTTTPTLVGTQREVSMTKDTPVFMTGGSDGTLDKATFEALVVTELAKYLDPNSEVIDNAVNLETHLYDSGFSLPTKKELLNFIALRKDTAVALGTHEFVAGGKVDVLADTRATSVLLKTQAKLFPESDFYGTPVARAVIMGGGYKLNSSLSGEYFPTTFELAIKSARLMGAGNYKWNAVYNFDHGSNAILKYGSGYEPAFIPAGIKPLLWNSGLVWAQPRDRHSYFLPAVQTVYEDDTSSLNNWLTVCALATLNRIASDAWREFTGTSTMSDAEFKSAVLGYLEDRINGIFDGLLVVSPDVIITADDAMRGYSWHVMFKLFAGTMKTKMVSYTDVYRLNDLGKV